MQRRAAIPAALLASAALATCGHASGRPHAASTTTAAAVSAQTLAAFFASPAGTSFVPLFGPGAGVRTCRFVPGGPRGQRAMHGRCATALRAGGNGTATVLLDQRWHGGEHLWVFRLDASGAVHAVSSSGEMPPQLWR